MTANERTQVALKRADLDGQLADARQQLATDPQQCTGRLLGQVALEPLEHDLDVQRTPGRLDRRVELVQQPAQPRLATWCARRSGSRDDRAATRSHAPARPAVRPADRARATGRERRPARRSDRSCRTSAPTCAHPPSASAAPAAPARPLSAAPPQGAARLRQSSIAHSRSGASRSAKPSSLAWPASSAAPVRCPQARGRSARRRPRRCASACAHRSRSRSTLLLPSDLKRTADGQHIVKAKAKLLLGHAGKPSDAAGDMTVSGQPQRRHASAESTRRAEACDRLRTPPNTNDLGQEGTMCKCVCRCGGWRWEALGDRRQAATRARHRRARCSSARPPARQRSSSGSRPSWCFSLVDL